MLLLDLGNSTIRLARADSPAGPLRTLPPLPARREEVEELVRRVREAEPEAGVAQGADGAASVIWIASVRPDLEEALVERLEAAGRRVRLIHDAARTPPLPHRLRTPETTGIDRLLAARGALPLAEGRGAIVLQAGSALTVDAVDAAGVFLGGFLLPGRRGWLAALGGAARVPDLSSAPGADALPPPPGPGTTTAEALLGGLAAGWPAAAAAGVERLRATTRLPDAPLLLAGGDADALGCAFPDALRRPHLVLEGLLAYASDG